MNVYKSGVWKQGPYSVICATPQESDFIPAVCMGG